MRKPAPAAAPASSSHPAHARPLLVHAAQNAASVTAMHAANGGSRSASVASTAGPMVVACTRNASGPSLRRPVMRTATHHAASAAMPPAIADGSRIANAFGPSSDMLAAVSQ